MQNFTDYLLTNTENNKKKIFINENLKYFQLKDLIFRFNKAFLSNFKGKLIGISINTSKNFLLTYLSVIKSGNVAVLIEKGFSEKRYEEICKKFKIDYFISDKKLDNDFFLGIKILEKKYSNFFEKKNIYPYKIKIKKKKFNKKINDIAVVLFTSGSSGEKKGVMLSHENLINNTESILKVLPIKRNDIVNLILPTTYSFGLSILNTHLKRSASIYIHNSPYIGSVIREIQKFRCTSLYGVPSSFEILINKTSFLKDKLISLKYVAQAGGNLSSILKKKLLKKFRNKVYIMYGATEASPRLSYVPPNMLYKKLESIGIPLPGVQFRLIKRNSKYSELAVKGKNIMKGYLNDPLLTNKKIKNKFFLTGDLAYKDKDDYYYIVKRIDKIIKRYGYKINFNFIERSIHEIKHVNFVKLIFNKENELILLVQTTKKMVKIVKKEIENTLLNKFASYEYPDKIFISVKKIISFNKKLSSEEIYNKFLQDKNVKQ